jgi:hypothetical protein
MARWDLRLERYRHALMVDMPVIDVSMLLRRILWRQQTSNIIQPTLS